MIISGLQKLTLLDFPGKTACTVFTAGCNMRCPFCHNASLVLTPPKKGIMEEDEFFHFLKKRKGILDGVCITGGEPLLHSDIGEFLKKIKAEGFLTKLDTNGLSPKNLARLLEGGLLDFVAMDIKNTPEKYALTAGLPKMDMDAVGKSVELLIHSGIDYEFRTTAIREFHKPEDFYEIALFIRGAKAYYIQNFVDSGDTIRENLHPFTKEMLEKAKEEAQKVLLNVVLRGI